MVDLSNPPLQPKRLTISKSSQSGTNLNLSYFRIQPLITSQKTFFGTQAARLRDFQLADPGYQVFLTADALTPYPCTDAAGQVVKSALSSIRDIHSGDRSAAVSIQLAAKLLGFVGMDMSNTISYRRPTHFIMCGKGHETRIDIVLMNSNYPLYLFLFIEAEPDDPVPRLLATGIAAFQWNNHVRNLKGVPSLKAMIFPAMTFRGSSPCFYLLRITKALSEAVINGASPNFATPLFRYIPLSHKLRKSGLLYVKARGRVLRVLENMKDFIPTGIDHIPQGWLRFLTTEDIYEPTSPVVDLDLRFLASRQHPRSRSSSPSSCQSHSFGCEDIDASAVSDRNLRLSKPPYSLRSRGPSVSIHTSSHISNPPSRSRFRVSRGHMSRNHVVSE